MGYPGRLRVIPSNAERARFFAEHRTDVPGQLRRQDRLGVVGIAVFVFLGGLSLVERLARRFA
jgi:hypothetical protein